MCPFMLKFGISFSDVLNQFKNSRIVFVSIFPLREIPTWYTLAKFEYFHSASVFATFSTRIARKSI